MQSSWRLQCVSCGNVVPADHLACPQCGGELSVSYDLTSERLASLGALTGPGIWRWQALLPLGDPSGALSLGEGNTPLVEAPELAESMHVGRIYLKLEGCNPTGSFKDRQVSAGLSRGRELGYKRCVTASSGNAGASLAAYAARAKMECTVFVDQACPRPKVDQMRVYGAQVCYVEGLGEDSRKYLQTYFGLRDKGLENGWWPMVTARPVNPFIVEGAKTIAFEFCESLGWQAPDAVFTPVGGGGLCGGLWKGLTELWNGRKIVTRPRIFGVQRGGKATPITRLTAGSRDEVLSGRATYGVPLDGHWAREAVEESDGAALAVEREEMLEAQSVLAKREGIFAEPQGIWGFAGLLKAHREGLLKGIDRIVCVITGMGLKDDVSRELVAARGPEIRKIHSIEEVL